MEKGDDNGADPAFTDPQGHPLPLPRTAEGSASSFETLVSGITRDVRPRAVLDEWLDRKLVIINDDEEIVLVEAAFVPHGDDDRKWHYLGRNLHDHIAAAAENVSSTTPRFLERAVHYDGLSAKLAKRLEARSRELMERAGRELLLGDASGQEAGEAALLDVEADLDREHRQAWMPGQELRQHVGAAAAGATDEHNRRRLADRMKLLLVR